MKKGIAILLAAALFMLAGCSGEENMTGKSYSSEAAEVKIVTVDVVDREIEITGSEDSEVHVDYFDSEKEYLDIALSKDGHLTVRLVKKDTFDIIASKPAAEYRRISLRLPADITVLTVKTKNEDISAKGISVAENISFDTNGGNILCDKTDVGRGISLTAKNGDISGTVVGGWDDFSIGCRIKKGDCNLPMQKSGGNKTFTAECNNGDIEIDFVK